MSQKIHTFSVSEIDIENTKLVEDLKKECRKTGQSFTWVVLQGLKLFKEQKECQKK